jgi:hypothetical protein
MSSRRISTAPVYQLKVTLKDSSPRIWRRILVSGDASLAKLHRILQVAMGWSNSHLHLFMIHRKQYSAPDEERELDFADERRSSSRICWARRTGFSTSMISATAGSMKSSWRK